jgi:hypothetical protein
MCNLLKGEGELHEQKNAFMKVEEGIEVDWAQILFNNLCSEFDRWMKM